MPISNYSVGRDITLVIVAAGGPVQFKGITSFRSKQDNTIDKRIKINGVVDHLRFFTGWSGTFDLDRQSGVLDDYFNRLEANYYIGVPEMPVFIDATIVNPDLSTSFHQYTKVLLSLEDAGMWQGDQVTKQSLSWVGSRRLGT